MPSRYWRLPWRSQVTGAEQSSFATNWLLNQPGSTFPATILLLPTWQLAIETQHLPFWIRILWNARRNAQHSLMTPSWITCVLTRDFRPWCERSSRPNWIEPYQLERNHIFQHHYRSVAHRLQDW